MIEAKEVLPIGATRTESVAARVVAATNKDLAAEVAAGRFREDLYYRLNVVSIHLPTLRERPEDIPDLIAVLLQRHARALNKRLDGLDNATVRRLATAHWKGNVRELGNALERAAILGDGPTLTLEDFPAELVATSAIDDSTDELRVALERFERQHIRRVLDRAGGDKKEGRPEAQPRPVVPLSEARRPDFPRHLTDQRSLTHSSASRVAATIRRSISTRQASSVSRSASGGTRSGSGTTQAAGWKGRGIAK